MKVKILRTPKFASLKESVNLFTSLGKIYNSDEVAIVQNPSYIYPQMDLYVLAKKNTGSLDNIKGIVKDMDGTTTTTEQLCLHSLEFMVRKISGREDEKLWTGLDKIKDYPHIIGNSTTKHVEYLIKKYGKTIKNKSIKDAYLEAACWTLLEGKDEGRRNDVKNNMQVFGLGSLLKNEDFNKFLVNNKFSRKKALKFKKYFSKIQFNNFDLIVRAAIDIYYTRYHQILSMIDKGRGEKLAKELLGSKENKLIEPMPGVAIYLATIKGWLGQDLELFYKELSDYLTANKKIKIDNKKILKGKSLLKKLGKYFEENPAKVAVVTSSISYEAKIVLNEVFRVIRQQIINWPLTDSKKNFLLDKFSDYGNIYDGFVTASLSSEMRLKPHRDLYSIALNLMGIKPENFDKVVGFEDSESGTIAIRAAGIGKCIAVPFADTKGHDLSAAAHILNGGLPEAILLYQCFLKL